MFSICSMCLPAVLLSATEHFKFACSLDLGSEKGEEMQKHNSVPLVIYNNGLKNRGVYFI